eukprot:15586_1
MSNSNQPQLGFNPNLAEYTPNGAFMSTWMMMYLYSLVGFILVLVFYCKGLFRPSCSVQINKSFQSITTRKYNNAGWHFAFICLTWFTFGIRHALNEENETAHIVIQIIWSIFYHLSILFYLLSVGPPPDALEIDNREWIVFIIFSLFLVIISFVVDLILLQSMFCYLLWFCSNMYLFLCTLIEIHAIGCSKTPFYYHTSILFTIFAMIIVFVSFHFFKGFESNEFINNYVLIIGCFIISTLFYFGALMLETKEQYNKQYGNGNVTMSSFDNKYLQQNENSEVVPINMHGNEDYDNDEYGI